MRRTISSFIIGQVFFNALSAYAAGSANFEAAVLRSRSPVVLEGTVTDQKRQRGWSAFGSSVIEEGMLADGSRSSRWVFDTSVSPRFSKSQIKEAFVTYLREQQDFKQVMPLLDLAAMSVRVLTEHVSVLTVPLRLNGIEIKQGYVEATFADMGSQYALRSLKDHSFVDAEIIGSPVDVLDLTEIRAITGIPSLTIDEHRVVLFPVVSDEGFPVLHYAGEYKVIDDDSKVRYTVMISHDTNGILEAFKHQTSGEYALRGEVYQRSYLDSQKVLVPLARTPITINGETKTTDGRGIFSANSLGTAVIALKSSLVSIVSAVNLTRTFQDKADIAAADNDLRVMNALTAIHRINRYTKRFLKSSESSFLTRLLTVRVNVSGSCNAFYNGEISLFAAGGGCANMALVNDVIFHEWGHGLDDYTGRRLGITDGAFSEGIGDIVSSYYGGSSVMGVGFNQGSANGIRQLNNNRKYPTNVSGAVHDDGLIIGGAFWDLRVALIARYGETKGAHIAADLFFKHLRIAETYRESYQQVLDVDDNDGNPATRSPNFCLISAAFAKHGLSSQAPCTDVVTPNPFPVDGDIALNFVEPAATSTKFAVSTQNNDVRGGWICLGSHVNCAENTRTALTIEGKDTARLFLVTPAALTFGEHTMVAVAVVDENQKVVGTRTFKIGAQ